MLAQIKPEGHALDYVPVCVPIHKEFVLIGVPTVSGTEVLRQKGRNWFATISVCLRSYFKRLLAFVL